jgi:hypothetical protein
MKITDFAGTEPRFAMERYFLGHVRGYGLVEDRWGKIRRQFVVDMEGAWQGDEFVLHENFTYNDGEKQERAWHISKRDANRYEATASDVEGVGLGQSYGQAANWRYSLLVPISGRQWSLAFDDWMFLQPDDVLINQVTMAKFGITVGQLVITFRRDPK